MGVRKDTYDQPMEFLLTIVIGRPIYAAIENTREGTTMKAAEVKTNLKYSEQGDTYGYTVSTMIAFDVRPRISALEPERELKKQ